MVAAETTVVKITAPEMMVTKDEKLAKKMMKKIVAVRRETREACYRGAKEGSEIWRGDGRSIWWRKNCSGR